MIGYEIKGGNLPVVICRVEPNETLITESGAMSWMSPNMNMETVGGSVGKVLGRALSGDTLFQNKYTAVGGEGLIAFASSFPGEIRAVEITPDKPVIVLQHEPVEFRDLKENGADLALCGHTHAGQIFPGNLIVPFFNENAYGYKNVSGLDTVVTAGVGYYGPPMRVGTNSEITVVRVHFGEGA